MATTYKPKARSRQDRATYVQPSVRTSVQWSPARIRAVLSSADGGYFDRLGELVDHLLADDRIKADLETRSAALQSLPFTLDEGADAGDDKSPMVEALEVGDWATLVPAEELQRLQSWALVQGFAVGELVYPDGVDEDGRMVPSLCVWHGSNVRFDIDARTWSVRVGTYGGTWQTIEPGDGKWVLYTPFGATRPWASGLWRGLALWWLLKCYARDDWGAAGENAARMFLSSSDFSDGKARRQLASEIANMGRGGVAVLPDGFSPELVEQSASTLSLYEGQIGTANKGFTIAIRGQNLGTDVEGGSYAAAQAHLRVDGLRLAQDARTLGDCLRDQVLAVYVLINFGAGAVVPQPTWDTDKPEDHAQLAQTMATLGEAVERFRGAGVPLSLDFLADRFGLEFAEVEDQAAAPVAVAPQTPEASGMGDQSPPVENRAPATPQAAPRPASGLLANAAGFVEGQTFADALTDWSTRRASEALAPMLDRLEALVDGVEDLDDARARILDLYAEAPDPDELATMAERVFMLAQLAGVFAVVQDAPEAEREP